MEHHWANGPCHAHGIIYSFLGTAAQANNEQWNNWCMRLCAFTLDVDRDVNQAKKGQSEAVSQPLPGEPGEFRFSSSMRGLEMIVDLLDELGIKATFFLEGETLREISRSMDVEDLLRGHEVASHGVCHEDITGESTGICLTGPKVAKVLEESAIIIEDVCSVPPKGFRAPYLHINNDTLAALAKLGYVYDSSLTREIIGGGIHPYRLDNGLWEVPLASGLDSRGKRIVSYLWPMHEGKRRPEDYRHMGGQVKDGLLVLATHSWHVVETFGEGRLPEERVNSSMADLRSVLEGLLDQGMAFTTIKHHLESHGDS